MVLNDLSLRIEPLHTLGETGSDQRTLVVHYTSIATLISMLTSLARRESVSFRLYDSAHFNDPDEGNYLLRNLAEGGIFARHHDSPYDYVDNPPHAYVSSFILQQPDDDDLRDKADNLVFWRTYGREGQGCSLRLGVPTSLLRKVFYGTKEAATTIERLQPIVRELKPVLDIPNSAVRGLLERSFSRV